MRYKGIIPFALCVALLFCARPSRGEAAAEAPKLKEVFGLITENLAGATEQQVNEKAVQGLLSALGPRVALIEPSATNTSVDLGLVSRSNVFGGSILYVRVASVGAGLDEAIKRIWKDLKGTNEFQGLVLDLRYAGGDGYAGAAATADLFLKKERPILNWGQGTFRSKPKTDALSVPVAVLVNGETRGAAEALAAALRETGTGLILGGKTAGQAMITSDFKLSTGQVLRIATAPIQLGDGATLTGGSVKPDINVQVDPADERGYYADAFAQPPRSNLTAAASSLSSSNAPSATNRPARRPRINEADLVRERRSGPALDLDRASSRDSEPERPAVADPALARALDVLKGLALVRLNRP